MHDSSFTYQKVQNIIDYLKLEQLVMYSITMVSCRFQSKELLLVSPAVVQLPRSCLLYMYVVSAGSLSTSLVQPGAVAEQDHATPSHRACSLQVW